jgi:HD-GYP domain-containing protein (c-di-GMP phosphodiesterase class II)
VGACDAFDAITSDRCYQSARSEQEALEELRRGSGTQFDPQVVQAICEVLGVRAGPEKAAAGA